MDLMIDLETMGIRPSSCIVSIGAAFFNEHQVISMFHTPVSLKSSMDLGLTTDQSTVDWWMKQSAEARSSWQQEDAPPLERALTEFNAWIKEHARPSQVRPWGNGADFDLVLLKSSFDAINADPPWKYYNHRCFRTMKSMFTITEVQREGVHHNALDDALHQVAWLQKICSMHRISLK